LKVLLTTLGSHGDAHPFLGIAAALKQRGHEPTLIANEHFAPLASAIGVEFVSVESEERYHRLFGHPKFWEPGPHRRELLEQGVMTVMPRVYRAIEQRYEPGRTVVMQVPWSFGARVAEDRLGVPTITCVISPKSFMSAYDSVDPAARMLPAQLKRWLVDVAEEMMLDPAFMPRINAFRRELGMRPVRRINTRWTFSPRRVIALFPDWFARPQPDWPKQVRNAGFVLHDASAGRGMPERLKQFLEAGSAPVCFVTSTAVARVGDFFVESIAACDQIEMRAVLVTPRPEQVPSKLPESVLHVEYAPFGELFPWCRAVVHQGAIGTAALAMAAGVPQLAVPHGGEQFENAGRLARLGVARVLGGKRYRAGKIADALTTLLWSDHVAWACRRAQSLMKRDRPAERVCEMVEEVAAEAAPCGA
jgi:UDP:flavonoid glycosyltransferase YjiC (YdhE family)